MERRRNQLFQILFSLAHFFLEDHGYKPQGKPWGLIPPQGAEYYTLRLWRDCSTCKFQYTSFLKFESHNNQSGERPVFLDLFCNLERMSTSLKKMFSFLLL